MPLKIASIVKDMGKLETSAHYENVKCWSFYEKQYFSSLKKLRQNHQMIQKFHFWVYPKNILDLDLEELFACKRFNL